MELLPAHGTLDQAHAQGLFVQLTVTDGPAVMGKRIISVLKQSEQEKDSKIAELQRQVDSLRAAGTPGLD